MHIKATRVADSSRQDLQGSTRKFLLSRLRRAIVYAEQLLDNIRELHSVDDVDVLEAEAYCKSMEGALGFEKARWSDVLDAYTEARFIYSTIAAKRESRGVNVFWDLINTNLDPSIRYAAYQTGLPRTTSIDAIVYQHVSKLENAVVKKILAKEPNALVDPKDQSKSGPFNTPRNISWRSRSVKIEDATTSQALGAVSAAEESLSSFLSSHQSAPAQTKASAYDQVLIPSQDAVDAVRTAIDELSAEGVSQGDERMQALQITRTAVNYALIGWRIGRNRVLCGPHDGLFFEVHEAASRPRPTSDNLKKIAQHEESTGHKIKKLKERAVLYDASIQSLDSVKELPGVAADQAFLDELAAKRAYFSALRCLAIALSHILLHHIKEGLALLSRALDLSSVAVANSSTGKGIPTSPLFMDISNEEASFLRNHLQKLVTQYRALVQLSEFDMASRKAVADTVQKPLIESLKQYPAGEIDLTKLVKYPPALEPIPVKPIFLDVAYNYINYPGHSGNALSSGINGLAEKPVEKGEKKEARKGWFGFGR